MTQSIIDVIISKKDFLPKKQKQLCEFIVENSQTMGLLTIADLAQKANVGTTTVMRVMKALNYDSFQDFKKEFHQYALNMGQSTWWHLQKSFDDDTTTTVDKSWHEINYVLNETLTNNFKAHIYEAVQLLLEKESIQILGLRTSKAIALYFEKMLAEFYPQAQQLSYDSDFLFDQVSRLTSRDVVVIIALAPFATLSLNVAEYCYAHGIPIVLITDQYSCPIASYAQIVLHTKASENQYSIVPVIALIETLVIEIGKHTKEYSIDRLEKVGTLLKEKNITT